MAAVHPGALATGSPTEKKIKLKHHIMLGSEGTAPAILNLDYGIKWVIVFHYQTLYQEGKSPRYRFEEKQSERQDRSACV
jgi:hypothetical protein